MIAAAGHKTLLESRLADLRTTAHQAQASGRDEAGRSE